MKRITFFIQGREKLNKLIEDKAITLCVPADCGTPRMAVYLPMKR